MKDFLCRHWRTSGLLGEILMLFPAAGLIVQGAAYSKGWLVFTGIVLTASAILITITHALWRNVERTLRELVNTKQDHIDTLEWHVRHLQDALIRHKTERGRSN